MAEKRIPAPTLMARLQLSAKGVAWAAERALAHGLEHFTGLLFVHQELEHFHARQWADGQ